MEPRVSRIGQIVPGSADEVRVGAPAHVGIASAVVHAGTGGIHRLHKGTTLSSVSLGTQLPITKSGSRLLFVTLMLGTMAQGLTFTASVSSLPQMAMDLGSRGVFFAQMTMALAALGLVFGALVSGWVLEQLGTRKTLLIAVVIYGLIGAGGLVLSSPSLLLATRFAAGFANACMLTTCVWAIAVAYDGHQRAKALGWSSSLANVSALAGTLLGGYLAEVGGWHLPFVQYLVFGVIALAVVNAGMGQVKPVPDPITPGIQNYLKPLLRLYLQAVLLFAVLFMASIQYPFLLEQEGIQNPSTRSLILGTVTVVAALMAFVYGPLQKLVGAEATFLVGLICMITALAATGAGLTSEPPLAVVCAALMGIYAGLIVPYLYHSVMERTDSHSRSHAIGLLTAFVFLGGFLNPPIFVALANLIGLGKVFTVVAVVIGIIAVATASGIVRRRYVG